MRCSFSCILQAPGDVAWDSSFPIQKRRPSRICPPGVIRGDHQKSLVPSENLFPNENVPRVHLSIQTPLKECFQDQRKTLPLKIEETRYQTKNRPLTRSGFFVYPEG